MSSDQGAQRKRPLIFIVETAFVNHSAVRLDNSDKLIAMPRTRPSFPQKNLTYEERVKALDDMIRNLPRHPVSHDDFARRCVSFIVGNGFDALSDGTRLTTQSVNRDVYGARGIKLPIRQRHATDK